MSILEIDRLFMEELVAKLVMFEEVDFGTFGFLRDASNANAILRGVTAAASSGEGSKLRILSMPGHLPYLSETLVEARKKLTVKILTIGFEELEVIAIDDDDDDDGDDDVNQP